MVVCVIERGEAISVKSVEASSCHGLRRQRREKAYLLPIRRTIA